MMYLIILKYKPSIVVIHMKVVTVVAAIQVLLHESSMAMTLLLENGHGRPAWNSTITIYVEGH